MRKYSAPSSQSSSIDRVLRLLPIALAAALAASLAACGGSDLDAETPSPELQATTGLLTATEVVDSGRMSAQALTTTIVPAVTTAMRVAAATATAQSSTNDCAKVRPFYWEVGARAGALSSGSVGPLPGTLPAGSLAVAPVTAKTVMPYASASKWLYGSYVAQRRQGVLNKLDVEMLTFESGYTSFKGCSADQSVDSCLATGTNGQYNAATDGRFFYSGGHMQKHASMNGMGAMTNVGLANAIKGQIGADVDITFVQPQLAGGAKGTPEAYTRFLRKLLAGGSTNVASTASTAGSVGTSLRMGSLLGTSAVCTSRTTCGLGEALSSPSPANETWHYSIGHWVEDDPKVGDGAFSSAGALGFYPWIDAKRTTYGVLARVGVPGSGMDSAFCGRLIRKAWALGVKQQSIGAPAPAPIPGPVRPPMLVSTAQR